MSKFEDVLDFQFFALQRLGKGSAKRAMNHIFRLQVSARYKKVSKSLRYGDDDEKDLGSRARRSIQKESKYINGHSSDFFEKFIDRVAGKKRGSLEFHKKYFSIVVSEEFSIRHFEILAHALILMIHEEYIVSFDNLPRFMYFTEQSSQISFYLDNRNEKGVAYCPSVVISDKAWFLAIAVCNFLSIHQYDKEGRVKKITFVESAEDLNDLAGFFDKISRGDYAYPPMNPKKRDETAELMIGLSAYLVGHEMRHFDQRHNRVDGIGQDAELEADIDGMAVAKIVSRSVRFFDAIPLFLMLASMILIDNPVESLKGEARDYPSVVKRYEVMIRKFKKYRKKEDMLQIIDNAERIARVINPKATAMDLS